MIYNAIKAYGADIFAFQDALKQLWMLAYPNRELPPLKSELWKEMGWQGSDPSTDFRYFTIVFLANCALLITNILSVPRVP